MGTAILGDAADGVPDLHRQGTAEIASSPE